MNSAGDLERLTTWLSEVHRKHADGCKGSCGERTVGYHHSDYDESYWFVQFGGYCLGGLPRRCVIKASNPFELKSKLEAVLSRAEQENADHDPEERTAYTYPEIEQS